MPYRSQTVALQAENAQLRSRIEELEAEVAQLKSPKKEGEENWQKQRRLFCEAYPGHCPRCGLPIKNCFHRVEVFRAEKSRISSNMPFDPALTELIKRHYREALEGVEDLTVLPPPPTRLLERELEAFLRTRRTCWDMLGEEEDP